MDGCKKEIGWLCHVSELDGEYVIDRCFLPEQEVAGAVCEFTEAGSAQIMTEVIQAEGIEYYNQIKCWAHSHVDMAARPSGQDKQQILKWKENDYFIMLITNKKGEFYAEFYDFKNKVAFNNLSVELYHPDQKRYNQKAADEIKERVSDRKPPEPATRVRNMSCVPGTGSEIKLYDKNDKSASSRSDALDAFCYGLRASKGYVDKLSMSIDEGEEYNEQLSFEDLDEEDAGIPCVIPGLNGDWIKGEYEQSQLWDFSKSVYHLSEDYPGEITYARVIAALLFSTGLCESHVEKELCGWVRRWLTMPDRAYIFNRAFNHEKYDDEVIDAIFDILEDDEYREYIETAMNEEDGLYSKEFCDEIVARVDLSSPESAQEVLLMLPLFMGASYSRETKDRDGLIEHVENLLLDDWVKKFLGK